MSYEAYGAEEEEVEESYNIDDVKEKKEKKVQQTIDDSPETLSTVKLNWETTNTELSSLRKLSSTIPKFHWIMRFQEIMLMPSGSSRRHALVAYNDSFAHEASRVGRDILLEINLPSEQKTIKPVAIGGVAGGEKFIHNGILYKLAVDPKIGENAWLYGDSEPDLTLAAKAASNEIKGANAYFQVFFEHDVPMTLPTQVMMDFAGYRLVAMPLLPLRGGQLVYGSGDAGRTIHNDHELVGKIMQFAGEKLHLAGHRVGDKLIYSAGDVEAHVGNDGQLYLLDLARTFPPESPLVTKHLPKKRTSVFARITRPEFLALLKEKGRNPISPDVFTMWGRLSNSQHNIIGHAEFKYLFDEVVPELAKSLDEAYLKDKFDDTDFEECMSVYSKANPLLVEPLAAWRRLWSRKVRANYFDGTLLIDNLQAAQLSKLWREVKCMGPNPDSTPPPKRMYGVFNTFVPTLDVAGRLHEWGVNVRHLGYVRSLCKQQAVRHCLLSEMVKREIKDQFRRFVRAYFAAETSSSTTTNTTDNKGLSSPRHNTVKVESALVEFFAYVLDRSHSKHHEFWLTILPKQIRNHFGDIALDSSEETTLYSVAHPSLSTIIAYVAETSGFTLKDKALTRWVEFYKPRGPPFFVGQLVHARWVRQEYKGGWYPAQVMKVNHGGGDKETSYLLHYLDDGFLDPHCPEQFIRVPKYSVDQRVQARWEGRGEYGATVIALVETKTRVKYDFGETKDIDEDNIVSGIRLTTPSWRDVIPHVRIKSMAFQAYVKAYALTEDGVAQGAYGYKEFCAKIQEAEAECARYLSSTPNSVVMQYLKATLSKVAQVNRVNLSFEEKKEINLLFLNLANGLQETEREQEIFKRSTGMERQDLIEMRELRRQIWETLVANLPPDTCTDLLCTAVRWQYDTKIAQFLVDHGADVSGAEPIWSFPVVKLAAWDGNLGMLKFLIDAGANLNDKRGGFDRSLFFVAVQHDFTDCMELIKEACDSKTGKIPVGTPVEAKWHKTPNGPSYGGKIVAANSDGTYHIAFNDGDVDENCPDNYITKRPKGVVDEPDTNGSTPLHWAAANSFAASVKWLIDHGATVNAADNQGRTPLDRATAQGHTEVIKILTEHGGKPGAPAVTSPKAAAK